MNKQGALQTSSIMLILVAVVGLGLYGMGAFDKFLGATTPGTPGEPSGGPIDVSVTGGAVSTTVTVGPQFDAFTNAAVTASTVHHDLVLNGATNNPTRYADAATFTAAPTDKMTVYYAINSSAYYAKKGNEITLGNTKGAIRTIDADGGKGLYPVVSTTGMTITIWNANDAVQANANLVVSSTNLTVGAGDTKSGRFRIQGQYQHAWSPAAPGLAICAYNSTANTYFHIMDSTGAELPKYDGTVSHVRVNDTTQSIVKYKIGSIIGSEVKDFRFEVKTDGTNGGGSTQALPIWCTLVDADWFQNSDTGEFQLGYETNANADVGITDGPYNVAVYLE